jgi:hypothetical protein
LQRRASGGRRNLLVTVGRTNRAGAAARAARLDILGDRFAVERFGFDADRRWQNIKCNRLGIAAQTRLTPEVFAVTIAGGLLVAISRPALTRATALALGPIRTLGAVWTLGAVMTLDPIGTLRTLFGPRRLLLLLLLLVGTVEHLVVAVLVVIIIAALRSLILIARAAFTKHPMIVIRELQIIFRLHPVARELGVTGHVLVLFQ